MAEKVVYGLYCVCDRCKDRQEGVRYVGQTGVRMSTRFSQHKYGAKTNSLWPVSKWIAKHGPENIRYTILDVCSTSEELDRLEEHWIRELGTMDHSSGGLNIRPGGNSSRGYRHSEYAKSRIGRPVTEDMKRKISETLKSKGLTGEKAPNSKLATHQVVRILERLWDGETLEGVAEESGTTLGIVWNISVGNTWPDVPRPTRPRKKAFDGRKQKGELPDNTKLTPDKVRQIRERYDRGLEGMEIIAADYGITGGNVSMIGRRKTWKHVK